MEFIINTKIDSNQKGYTEKLGENNIIDPKNQNYLDLTVLLILRFVEGHPSRDLPKEFYRENLAIKATACELLEMILSKTENQELRTRLSICLLRPVLQALKNSITRGESVILIQLLSQLRVVLLKSNLQYSKKNNEEFQNIIRSKQFMDTLLKGLKNDFHYIVTEFTQFINSSLIMLSEIMTHPNQTDIVKNVLSAYYDLIVEDTEFRNRAVLKNHDQSKQANFNEENNENAQTTTESSLMVLLEGLEFVLKLFVGEVNLNENPHGDYPNF